MTITIYHNPRCSKSRETLALLEDAGADVVVVEYLKNPLCRAELARLYAKAGMTPREGLRTAEDAAKDMPTGPDGAELSNLTKAIVVAVRRMGGDPRITDQGWVAFDADGQVVGIRPYPGTPVAMRVFVEYPLAGLEATRERMLEVANQVGVVLRTVKTSLLDDVLLISSDCFVLHEADVAPMLVLGMHGVVAGGTVFREVVVGDGDVPTDDEATAGDAPA